MSDTRSYIVGQHEVGELIHDGQVFASGGSSVIGVNVTGYQSKSNCLDRWNGSQLLSGARFVEFKDYRFINEFGDSGAAVGWKLTRGRWIVGYSLGAGMLFRGELVHTDDPEEAERFAIDLAEQWMARDVEAEYEDPERWDGLS